TPPRTGWPPSPPCASAATPTGSCSATTLAASSTGSGPTPRRSRRCSRTGTTGTSATTCCRPCAPPASPTPRWTRCSWRTPGATSPADALTGRRRRPPPPRVPPLARRPPDHGRGANPRISGIMDGKRGGGQVNERTLRRGVRAAMALFLVTLLSLLVPGCRIVQGPPAEDVPPPVTATPEKKTAKPSGRRPGVVNIETEQNLRGTRAAGTGVVLTATGLVLTNNHVIRGATKIQGTDTDNRRTYTARVVGYDRAGDIAVIRLEGATRLKAAAFASASGVEIGDPVTAVGNAGGEGGRPRVVTGRVTALEQSVTARDDSSGTTERLTGLIETDAPIEPGDSGG